jgi:hypothetical protein
MGETISFFGAIAVSMGLLSEEDLAQAVTLQEELESKDQRKRLGDILCDAKHISPNDVEIILAMQQTYDSVTEETRFGELAIANGLVSREDVEKALSIQKEGAGDKTVGEILVELGMMSTFQMGAILISQGRLRKIFNAQ